MLKFVILTLLSAVLMVLTLQYKGILHAPMSNAIIDKKNALLLRLLESTFNELDELSRNVGEVARTLTEKVVAEFQTLPEKSATLQAKITELEQFLEHLHQLEEIEADRQIDAQLDSKDVLPKFSVDYGNDIDNDIIEMALEKAGMYEKEEELNKKMSRMSKRFMKSFDEYVATLSPKEKASKSALLDWYERFKTMDDDYQKIIVFEEFFAHFIGDDQLIPLQSTCKSNVKYCELNRWTSLKLTGV